MIEGFDVYRRNYGHWDISNKQGRIFCIRGGPGKYYIRDEREGEGTNSSNIKYFSTVTACMTYICDILMFELIIVEGQTPQVIESWNL
jgi:hypothetical protein